MQREILTLITTDCGTHGDDYVWWAADGYKWWTVAELAGALGEDSRSVRRAALGLGERWLVLAMQRKFIDGVDHYKVPDAKGVEGNGVSLVFTCWHGDA